MSKRGELFQSNIAAASQCKQTTRQSDSSVLNDLLYDYMISNIFILYVMFTEVSQYF
jgi:hypothetical protein